MSAKRGEKAASIKPARESAAQSYKLDNLSFKRTAATIIYVSGNCGEQASRELRPILKHFTRAKLEAMLVESVEHSLLLWDAGMDLARESDNAHAKEHELQGAMQRIIDLQPQHVRRTLARSGGAARWASDPTQTIKFAIYEEWKKWQMDRSLYRYPRDFRRAMQIRFPGAEDGTMKNWLSDWGKGKVPE